MYYNICPECGVALDPGEKCDCKKERGVNGYVAGQRNYDSGNNERTGVQKAFEGIGRTERTTASRA